MEAGLQGCLGCFRSFAFGAVGTFNWRKLCHAQRLPE